MINRDEWSGVLLYKIEEGSLDDPDSLIIKCIGLYPMDIGTSVYTEFESDPESIIEMAERFPEYEEGKLFTGLIHTHHHMTTGFSGTDHEELQENAEAHNAYLSLIVNFAKTPSAKIAFKVTNEIDHTYHFKNTNGEMCSAKGTSKEEFIAVYKCDVSFETTPDNWMVDRVLKLEEERKARRSQKTVGFTNPNMRQLDLGGNYARASTPATTKKEDPEVLRRNKVRSFICKTLSLNIKYTGTDIRTCVSSMNSKMLNYKGKDNPEKKIKYGYMTAMETNMTDIMESIFGDLKLDEEYTLYEEALEMIKPYKNYMVADAFSTLLDEYLLITDEQIDEEDFIL